MKRIIILIAVALMSVSAQVTMAQQAQPQQRPGPQPSPENGEKFKLGMAGYTFANFDIDKTLETMKKMDVHYLTIKDFHLPLNSTVEQIDAFNAKLKANGVIGYAVGPIYMKSEADIDKAFEYANRAITHTPTLIELYLVKAKICKHKFDHITAFELTEKVNKYVPDFISTKTYDFVVLSHFNRLERWIWLIDT